MHDRSSHDSETDFSTTSTNFYVVGIGASAGGLQALEELFANISPDLGAAYVVVQHLSPDFESKMDELLRRQTAIPIVSVTDGVRVEPNHIYLLPPRSDMIMSGGRLLLTERAKKEVFRLPIDHFFRSMAQDVGRCAVGVVLSGTGSDGSRGIREIHEAGGLVVTQSAETARFDGMPRNAQATGIVDLVLAPSEIAEALADYIGHLGVGQERELFDRGRADQASVDSILQLLKDRHGVEFKEYKPTTVGRRIWRRIALTRAGELDEYCELLNERPEEVTALYQDLLISVTRFFRDSASFECLRDEVIPGIVEKANLENGVRIWVPACATGEEVYSLGILFCEEIDRQGRPLPLKIFATDVDDIGLSTANKAVYPEESLADLSDERRERFFRPDQPGYFRVAKHLREKVVFARHDILSDPPFTGLDLVACRNLLIYLKPTAQKKALMLFHFGLRHDGVLFLGNSETPSPLAEEFHPVSSKHRIFRKSRDVRLPPEPRLFDSRTIATSQHAAPGRPGGRVSDSRLLSVYETLLGAYVPPSVLVDRSHNVVHAFAGAEQLVQFRGGRMSTNLLDLVHPDIKMAVSGALRQAERKGEDARYTGVRVDNEDGSENVYEIVVKPIDMLRADSYFLVTIESPGATPIDRAAPVEAGGSGDVDRDYLASVESELRYTQENLQATVEELETSNEELQAANEELVASNEELQSTNEELQSVNEELYTVNTEYQEKIRDLTRMTDDMDNLLQSIEVGVVFLDEQLRIRKFTSQVADTFNLLPQDIGRRFDNFAHNICHPALLDDIQRVLDSGEVLEQEVSDSEGGQLFLRILPYQSSTEQTAGVVITLIDVGALKRAEADVRRLSKMVAQSHDAIVGLDPDATILSWNEGARKLYGYTEEEAVGSSFMSLVAAAERDDANRLLESALDGTAQSEAEMNHLRKNGASVCVGLSVSPIRDEQGEAVGVTLIARDVTERKRAEEQVQRSIKQRDNFVALLSHELRNPLMALLTASRLYLDAASDREQKARAARIVGRQTLHMARLLDDLLDVSRMRQDKIEMRRAPLDLRDTVADVLDEVGATAAERGIDFQVVLDDEPVSVFADRTRLKQVQANLLTNAFKATPPGGKVCFSVRRDAESDEAVIRVEDDGVGIDPWLLDTIFEPFVQGRVDDDGNSRAGLGLGLALVESVTRAHKGSVQALSEGDGKGAVFEVRLPLHEVTEQEAARGDLESSSVCETTPHRLLFVEDQTDNRELMEVALRSFGYDVHAVGTGREAVAALQREPFTVGVIDVGLPDMSGLDVARAAREVLGPKVRLLAVTGHGRQKDRDEILEAGFDLHLVKPVEIEKLVASIEDE